MSTDLIVDGNFRADIVDYAVNEDSTPLLPIDNSGGVSELSVELGVDGNESDLIGKIVDIADTGNGGLRVTLIGMSGDEFSVRMSGTTTMQRLNSEIYCPPAMGVRLDDYLESLFDAVGISTVPQFDSGTGAIIITAIGWQGILWDKIKSLCVMHRLEIAAIGPQVVVRPVRGRIAETQNVTELSWDIEHTNLVTSLSVVDYQATAHPTPVIVYPPVLGEGSAISADAYETVEIKLQTEFSLASVVPPQYGATDKYDTTALSRFAVTDGTNTVMTAEQFQQGGGFLTAEIDPEDDSAIIVTFRAPYRIENAPYRVGIIDGGPGSTEVYSSLRITGTGVRSVPRSLVMDTGITADGVVQVREARVDNIFASDTGKAYQLALAALAGVASYNYTLRVTADIINRRGETGLLTGQTYSEFDTASGSQTYTQFDTAQGAKTYAEFEVEKKAINASRFENQAFGNVAGARHTFRDSYFRIRSATIRPDGISYSAEQDTTHADFAAAWNDGSTYAEFAAEWAGVSYLDFGVRPLWRA